MSPSPKDRSPNRPKIASIHSGAELKRWYWRKDELQQRAKSLALKSTGAKFDLLDRIAAFLDTGAQDAPGQRPTKPQSRFDWHAAALSDTTVITDNYKNTQNVRRYFKSRLGSGFKFNIAFMEWMRENAGQTLGAACTAYTRLKSAPGQTKIKDHNQFNQYTRDFLADNPGLGMDDVRRIWALKIDQPSATGRHQYDPADLLLDPSQSKD